MIDPGVRRAMWYRTDKPFILGRDVREVGVERHIIR
jgi:hypothetical protein